MEKIDLYDKIREIICKESTSPSEQKSASSRVGKPHSPLSRGRVRLANLINPPISHILYL
jgi:hypothetical protein